MFNHSLQEASRLNCLGATMLTNHDFHGALSAFRSAIQIMEATSRTEEAYGKLRSNQEKVCAALEMADFADTEAFFVFNKPLVFEMAPQVVDLSFFNAIIIYNLALTFHHVAVRRGDLNKLRKAVHFYQLCCNLIHEDSTASAASLLLAARNNATHAYLKLGDYEKFREGMIHLQQDTANLSAQGSASLFEEQHLQEFFLNITLAKEPTAAPSA
ncbi:expressed unknown protein [Seminavis robusta]|uniref:Uncharacterized protein n=1 Tax=Seminavis robusta TaxID=568900 RepID=A0A9N8HVY1_9STRA|nr:expressed unknown protein [Seminavis robusta]|eukprot:Sro1888_g303600.1 n/a (214) ;mRNA; f:2092-2733